MSGKRGVWVAVVVAALAMWQWDAQAQVTYRLGEAVEMLDASFYAGHAAFFGRTSNDGKQIVFWGKNASNNQSAFYVVDIGNPASYRRITPEYPYSPNTPVNWTPDDSALFVGGFRIPVPPQGQYQEIIPWPIHGISVSDVSATAMPSGNWEIAQKRMTGGAEIVALPILNNGEPDPARQPVYLTNFNDYTIAPDWISTSPDGTLVAFADYHSGTPDTGDVYVLKNVPEILAAPLIPGTLISSLAPVDAGNPNLVAIRTTDSDNFAEAPAFSQDKSLLIFSEDFNNVFRDSDFFNTFALGDFDLMIADSDGSGDPFRLAQPGNQAFASSTPGGIRIVYNSGVDGVMHLFMSTLEVVTAVQGTQQGNNDVVTAVEQEAQDGSGTVVTIPPATTIDFPDGVDQEIQVLTPVDPVEPVQLPPDVAAIPVLRDFGPDGTQFNPAITVTISYTDAEIEGLDEASLRVFRFNPATNVYDIEVTTGIVRDPANNRISFSVDHFSTYGLGAPLDTDGDSILDSVDPDDDNDGAPDAEDPKPLDTDNDGIDNTDDPDDDNDGSMDGEDSKPLDTDNDNANNDVDTDDDSDGILDSVDAFLFDTDNDGQNNAVDTDDDNDGLADTAETITHHTNPLSADSDGDGASDSDEITAGTDPNAPPVTPMPAQSYLSAALLLLAIAGAAAVRASRPRRRNG